MWRERALKFVLVLVGVLFTAGIYPIIQILWGHDKTGYADAMMLSLYFTLGILLLLAVRNPAEHRSLIAFAAWSSVAHGVVMTVIGFRDASERDDLVGSGILIVIAVLLFALNSAKRPSRSLAEPVLTQ
jgi:Na+/H+ antiporter NhaA